jgi:hypothetical protein
LEAEFVPAAGFFVPLQRIPIIRHLMFVPSPAGYRDYRRRIRMGKAQKKDRKLSGTPLRVGSAPEARRNELSDPSGTKTITVLEPETRARRRASGPRTAIGKQRSRLNAQTHGIFSRGRIVGDESASEFEFLLKGLVEDLKPEGTLETILVDQLATILWRRRRVLRSESAEIDKAIRSSAMDTYIAQAAEVWDRVRSGEATGGILKYEDNPLILREAILMLSVERFGLEKFGFRRNPPWILRRLYGLDHEDAAPFGTIFHMYLNFARSEGQPENSATHAEIESEENRKNAMLKILDEEIERPEKLREASSALCLQRIEYNKLTHLVPPPAVSERLLRYETHLSREFDRTLSQLERLQRMRLGQPVVPPIHVRLSG